MRSCVAYAALLLLCTSSVATAQLVAAKSQDPSVLDGLPTPIVARAQTGPYDNAQLFGESLPTVSKQDFPFTQDVPVPFILEVTPSDDGALVRFTLGTVVLEQFAPPAEADEIFGADAIYVVANSFIPEVIATADNLRLDVTTGSAGSVSEIAQAIGGTRPDDLLSLSGVSFALGLVLSGNITFLSPYPLQQVPASVEFRLVETGIDPLVDGDLDGIPDEDDNCPVDSNQGQANNDNDTLGDACDNCPGDDNQDQDDADGDTIGEACDNCPLGCTPANGFEDCRNTAQKNSDDDFLGDVCDNCDEDTNPPVCVNGSQENPPEVASEIFCTTDAECMGQGFEACRQPDGDFDGEGDECERPGIAGVLQGPLPPTPEEESPFGLGPITNQDPGDFILTVKCGPRDLTTANIPILLPPSVTQAQFEDCALGSDDPGPEKIGSCAGTAMLGNVDPSESLTRGPSIELPAATDDDLFLISLAGNLAGGQLCTSDDASSTDPNIRNRPLGTLKLEGLNLSIGDVPVIATDQLTFFEAEKSTDIDIVDPVPGRCRLPEIPSLPNEMKLCTVVSEGDTAVATEITTTSVVLNSGVKVEVRPAVGEVTTEAVTRWQLTVEASDRVHIIGLGLRAFTGITGADGVFGGCNVPITVQGQQVLACNPGNPDLGPGIQADGDLVFDDEVPAAYVLPPGAAGAPAGLDPNSFYLVLKGGLNPPDEEINPGDKRVLLGVFEYQSSAGASPPQPVVITTGVNGLLNPDDIDGETLLPGPVVFVGDTTSTGVDTTGGTGTTPNSDGDNIDDDTDNCITVTNETQDDDGRFLALRADDVGNICQCGAADAPINDGAIFEEDAEACADALGNGETTTLNAQRCIIAPTGGGPAEFSIEDVVKLNVAVSEAGACDTEGQEVCFTNNDCAEGACLGVTDKGVDVQQACPQAGQTGG